MVVVVVTANLLKVTGHAVASKLSWDIAGTTRKITGSATTRVSVPFAISGSLNPLTGRFTNAKKVDLSGSLNRIVGSGAVTNINPHVSITANLKKISGNQQLINSQYPLYRLNGQIKKLSGVLTSQTALAVSGQLLKLTGNVRASNSNVRATIGGQLNRITASISTLPIVTANVNLRRLTSSIGANLASRITINGSMQSVTGSATVDKQKDIALVGQIRRLTASVTVINRSINVDSRVDLPKLTASVDLTQKFGIITADLPALSGMIDVDQSTYIKAGLKPLTASVSVVEILDVTINGQLNKIKGVELRTASVNGQLRKLTGAISQFNPITLSGSLKKITGSANVSQAVGIAGHVTANIAKLSASIRSGSSSVVVLSGQLHKIQGSSGQLRKITGSILASSHPSISLSGNLKKVTGSFSVIANDRAVISGNLRKVTSAIVQSFVQHSSLAGQLKKITGSMRANPRYFLALNGTFSIRGSASVSQIIAHPPTRPSSLLSRKITIQNPASFEPQLTMVGVDGQNLMASRANYDDPGVYEILHGLTTSCFLGNIGNGSDLTGQSSISIAATSAQISLTNPAVTLQILPGLQALPTGLVFNMISDGNASISGHVSDIPISVKKYEFMIRVTNSLNISIDRYFYFNVTPPVQQLYWAGPYSIGNVGRGNIVNFALPIVNSLGLPLTYTVSPELPPYLQITSDRISGVININTSLQPYSFTITATDGTTTVTSNPFTLNVVSGSNTVSISSNSIKWITTNSNLGSTYTTMPSYFGVKAINPSGHPVTYALAPYSNPLPSTLTLNSDSGNIVGLTPTLLQTQTYNFTVRATTNSSYYNDKNFSITILRQFNNKTVLVASMPMEEPARLMSAISIWDTGVLKDSNIFRPEIDINFGRVLGPKLILGSRSFTTITNMTAFQQSIKSSIDNYSMQGISVYDPINSVTKTEYYSGLKVYLGELQTAAVHSPDGQYIYDVIYITVVDQQASSGGFVNGIETPIYNTKIQPAVRIYPKSLANMRNAYSTFADGQDTTNAGLPLWQRETGWQPCIELLYVLAGKGQTVLDEMIVSGMGDKLRGLEWTFGRVILDQIT